MSRASPLTLHARATMLPPEGWPTERVTLAYATFRGVVPGVNYAHLTLPPANPTGARAPIVMNLHGGFWKTDWGLHSERVERGEA